MGNSPSTPTAPQMAELEATMDESVQRAAAAIAQADVLLLLTGAGWSADSGLSVYRDVADVAEYRERDLTYASICEPHWFEDDPALAYGFWGKCFNDYRDTAPHAGYGIVKRWRDAMFDGTATSKRLAARHGGDAEAFFSFTSNVDAHHLGTFGASEVRECHGNSETWQCTDRECHTGAAGEEVATSRWAAPGGFRFAMDGATQNAATGRPSEPPDGSVAQHGFGNNRPACPRCQKALRPSILMFSDASWNDNAPQKERWTAWEQAVEAQAQAQVEAGEAPLHVAILEVGAGGNVTTVRSLAERTVESLREKGGVATLVRINPDLPLADSNSVQDATIGLPSYGLAAVQRIDEALNALRSQGPAAVAARNAIPLLLETAPIDPKKEEPSPEETSDPLQVKPREVPPSSPEGLAVIRETFAKIDTDGSGTLDRAEVENAGRMLGRVFYGTDLDDAMAAMDGDGNGEVDFAEFTAWWEGGGKLNASERFELKWAQFGARFDQLLADALGASGIK